MVGEAFTFHVPEGMPRPEYGQRVALRVAGHALEGIVLGFPAKLDRPDVVVQDIDAVLDIPTIRLSKAQCDLILWIAREYFSPLHKVLRLFLPQGIHSASFHPRERLFAYPKVAVEDVPHRQKQVKALVARLHEEGSLEKNLLRQEFSLATYKKALTEEYVEERSQGLWPVQSWSGKLREPLRLTREQKSIVRDILRKKGETALLYGVTGAGKTEMYLHIALQRKQEGKQTALLVPEIALTPQLVQYFQKVFGERVAVVHSHIAEGEKCQEWHRVAKHEVDVLIGSRSALFAPFAHLGQVIVDEEHEWTYKNEQNPRYLLHRVAEMMSEIAAEAGEDLNVLFASGTPSIERLARARGDIRSGKPLYLYTLDQKIFEQTPDSGN